MEKRLMDYLPEAFIVELSGAVIDSISPISGQETKSKPNPFDITRIKIGDTVKVRSLHFEGTTGKVINIANDVASVRIDISNSTQRFHINDLTKITVNPNKDNDPDRDLENLRKLAGYQ